MKKISKVLLPLILMLSSSHVMSADVYRVNVTQNKAKSPFVDVGDVS